MSSPTFEDLFTPVDEIRKTEPNYGCPLIPNKEIVEKDRFDLNTFLSKTPVSILEEGAKIVYQMTTNWRSQEILTKTGVDFEIFCTLAGVTVSGKASSKKVAKQKAALLYLHEVVKKGRHKDFFIPGNTEEEAHKAIDMLLTRDETRENSNNGETCGNEVDDNIPTANNIPSKDEKGNWVGKLQELLHRNKMDAPKYECDESGQSKSKKFICTCTVSKQMTRGIATTKKAAKTISAYLMCSVLDDGIDNMYKEMIINGTDINEVDDGMERIRQIYEVTFKENDVYGALKMLLSDKARFETYEHSFKLPSTSVHGFKQVFLEVRVTLVPQDTDDLELGAEHTKTADIQKASARERKRALEGGPFVFCGSGTTEKDAEDDACRSALIHFNTYSF